MGYVDLDRLATDVAAKKSSLPVKLCDAEHVRM